MSRSEQSNIGCLIRFIPAGAKTDTNAATSTDRQAANKQTLSGEEAKAFYEEVLGEENATIQPTSSVDCKRKANRRKGSKASISGACKNRISREHNDLNVNVVTGFQDRVCELSAETRSRHQKSATELSRGNSVGNTSNCSRQNEYKLLSFAQNGDLGQVTKLLKYDPGIDVDYRDQFGWTALMCATVARHEQIVQFLLSKGANRWLSNTVGKSAVSLAEEIGAKEIIKVFTRSEEKMHQSTSTNKKRKQSFYCEICSCRFSEMSEKEHSCSTVHLFNLKLKPKPDPFMIPESNIGYRLMRSSGWDGEKGLGPEGKGAKFPVKTVLKTDRLCLGSEELQRKKAKITHFGPNDAEAVEVEHKHTLNRVLSARASSKKERRRREQKEKRWERNLRQYWDIDCDSVDLEKM